GIDCERVDVWTWNDECVSGGNIAGGRRGLSTTDGICGIGNCRGVREQCGGGEVGSELCTASDIQRGTSCGGNSEFDSAGASAARRRSRKWSIGAGGGGICGPRGRVVFSGMVRIICCRRRNGRQGLFLLPAVEPESWRENERGIFTRAIARCGEAFIGDCPGGRIHCLAVCRHQ